MDESERKHLDTANENWTREEARARRWRLVLRLLPAAVVAFLLLLAFSVFH